MSMINQENVEAIKRSVQIVGPLQEIIKDQNGRTLIGRHREQVDQGWPTRTIEVKDGLERELIILLGNVQRQPTEEELKYRLNRVAMEYWMKHKCPEEKVCVGLCEMLSPEQGAKIYTARRIQQLLEPRWKAQTIAKKGETISPSLIDKKAGETKEQLDKLSVRGGGSEPAQVMQGCLCPTCPNKGLCY